VYGGRGEHLVESRHGPSTSPATSPWHRQKIQRGDAGVGKEGEGLTSRQEVKRNVKHITEGRVVTGKCSRRTGGRLPFRVNGGQLRANLQRNPHLRWKSLSGAVVHTIIGGAHGEGGAENAKRDLGPEEERKL